MTYVNSEKFIGVPLEPGRAFGEIDSSFHRLARAEVSNYFEEKSTSALADRTPVQARLTLIQGLISDVSMHLPEGFARGLNRQFANLMDEEAWETSDDLISPSALSAFLIGLIHIQTNKRPGIGTNGIGSVTAAWTEGPNRLTIEFLESGKASLVLTRYLDSEEPERAALAPMPTGRLREVLAPFSPEVWFDI